MSKKYSGEIVRGIKEHVEMIKIKRNRIQEEEMLFKENEEKKRKAEEAIERINKENPRIELTLRETKERIANLEKEIWKRMKELKEESIDGQESPNPLINNGKTVDEIYGEMINFLKENHINEKG